MDVWVAILLTALIGSVGLYLIFLLAFWGLSGSFREALQYATFSVGGLIAICAVVTVVILGIGAIWDGVPS